MIDAKIPVAPERLAIKWRATVFSALLAACALAGGCASVPDAAPYELGRAPASDLVGLTQDEIMERLGGHPSGEFYLNRISIEDGERVSSIFLVRLGEGSCPRNFRSWLAIEPPDAGLAAVGVFHQERFAGLTDSHDRGLSPDTVIVLSCAARDDRLDGDAMAMWTFYTPIMVILSPAIAVTLPGALTEERRRRELWASVRLGEPLSGGAEGFADAYGEPLQIVHEGSDVRIGNYGAFSITLRDDRVQAIDRGTVRCRLMSDASLDCE